MRTETLDLGKIGFRFLINPELKADEYVASMLSCTFKAKVPFRKLMDETCKHPRDWWEHFKLRWFPRWALKRWPVAWTTHLYGIDVVYDVGNIAMPPYATDMAFMVHKDGELL